MSAKGILGRKLGMTQIWDDENRVVPVTVIEAGPCRVVQLKTPERDGYSAVQLAFGDTKPPAALEARARAPQEGRRAGAAAPRRAAGRRPRRASRSARCIGADVFGAGERVDVTGISKGKGFTGAMQRHNFKGQGASHGNHKKHRSPGSIGACATPARVFKGMKMAGQYGNARITTLNLEVVEGDAERGLLLIKGAVPGPNGGLVFVRNAVKAPASKSRERGMKLDVKSATGAGAGTVDVPDELFGIEPNIAVMHQVVTAQLAAARAGTHSTKTRAEVRRRWRQAVAPEGHRPGPPGLDPRAALARRRCGARPEAPRLPAAHAQEDDPPRPALARSPTARPRARSSWSTTGASTSPAPRPRSSCSARSACAPQGERDERVLLVLAPRRGRGVEVVPQPRRAGAARPPRRAQHLRRAASTTGSSSARPRSRPRSRASATAPATTPTNEPSDRAR